MFLINLQRATGMTVLLGPRKSQPRCTFISWIVQFVQAPCFQDLACALFCKLQTFRWNCKLPCTHSLLVLYIGLPKIWIAISGVGCSHCAPKLLRKLTEFIASKDHHDSFIFCARCKCIYLHIALLHGLCLEFFSQLMFRKIYIIKHVRSLGSWNNRSRLLSTMPRQLTSKAQSSFSSKVLDSASVNVWLRHFVDRLWTDPG